MTGYLAFPLLIGGILGAGAALAQVPDPTRPPDAEAAGSAAAAAADSGVQTVILRRGGKSAAVIDGQYVEIGGKVGDKRVLKISESEVVLKGPGGREVLKVTPAVDKKSANGNAATKSGAARAEKK